MSLKKRLLAKRAQGKDEGQLLYERNNKELGEKLDITPVFGKSILKIGKYELKIGAEPHDPKTIRVYVFNSYDIRKKLSDNGYIWDGAIYDAWFRDFRSVDDTVVEVERLKGELR